MSQEFQKLGAQVTFGCSEEFRDKVLREDLNFYEIDISSNKNVGKAETTDQPDTEKMRLEEFFQATKKGAVETLITQSHHRKADMLYNPHELIERINKVNTSLNVDLYVVDILSYSVTLSLYFLNLPFITYCPPHPDTIPKADAFYGVPRNWPSEIKVNEDDLQRLKQVSLETQKEFTRIFNDILNEAQEVKNIDNAFSLVSEIGTIYNYFDFYQRENIEKEPYQIYAGNSFKEDSLDEEWSKKMKTNEKKIIITMGTFLSYRKDVLEKLIVYTRRIYPKALIIVSAGSDAKDLSHLQESNTIIESFIPQIGLMPYMDTVIFHGGCNTFTEAMYYGKDMIILPFSSDQFNIAYDVKTNNLGSVLDPNHFEFEDLEEGFKTIEDKSKESLMFWSQTSKERGADFAAKIILK